LSILYLREEKAMLSKRSGFVCFTLWFAANLFSQSNQSTSLNGLVNQSPRSAIGAFHGNGRSVARTFSPIQDKRKPQSTPIIFGPPVTDGAGPGLITLAIADVNGDGKLDIVTIDTCGTSSYCLGVLLGKGNGTFRQVQSFNLPGFGIFPTAALADVNKDGKIDLIIGWTNATTFEGLAAVYLGNGDGTFQAPQTYISGGYYAGSVAVADVNGDGNPDVLVANGCSMTDEACDVLTGGSIGVLLGNGDGTFDQVVTYYSGGAGAGPVVVADVNADGHPDLIVLNGCFSPGAGCQNQGDSGGVGVLLGNGDGTFWPAVTFDTVGYGPVSMAVGDLNGDGKPDVLVSSQCAGTNFPYCGDQPPILSALLGNGDGTFQNALITSAATLSVGNGPLALADLNGDGKLDVAGGGLIFLGNGDGTFQPSLPLGATGPTYVTDLNRDGKPDLVVGGEILLNISPEVTKTTLTSSPNPSAQGQTVTFTATVTSTFGNAKPTGSVVFDEVDGLPQATRPLVGGKAVYKGLPEVYFGAILFTATYQGTSNIAGSTSEVLEQYVKLPSKTTLTSSPNPSILGQAVTFTAKVPGALDGEIIKFMAGARLLGTGALSSGVATFTTSTLSVGTTAVTAVYAGDQNYEPNTSKPVNQVVNNPAK
jgi:hypothetical protein